MATTKFTVPNTEIQLEVDLDTLEVLTPIKGSTYVKIQRAAEESYDADEKVVMKFSELVTIDGVTLECLIFGDTNVVADWDDMKDALVYSKSDD